MSFGALLGQRPSSGGMTAEILVEKGGVVTNVVVTDPDGENISVNDVNDCFVAKTAKYGEYKVDITLGQEVAKRTVNIDACKQFFVEWLDKVLNNNNWGAIRAASDSNKASTLWSVGDAKEITLNGTIGIATYNNFKTWVYILGFNHNAELEGNNMIHFGCFRNGQENIANSGIALIDADYDKGSSSNRLCFNMNSRNTTQFGWEGCQMRKQLINADVTLPSESTGNTFLHALPDDLKAVMKRCTKYSDNKHNSDWEENKTDITSTQDWAFLLSEFEVFGNKTNGNKYEKDYQKRYDFYEKGNTNTKYKQTSLSSVAVWFTRSIVVKNTEQFCTVGSSISQSSYTGAAYSQGFAPAFCV